MKNKLTDLNDHLFTQIERLNDESLSADDIAKEVTRARAVTAVAEQVINNADLMLRAVKAQSELSHRPAALPPLLTGSDNAEG